MAHWAFMHKADLSMTTSRLNAQFPASYLVRAVHRGGGERQPFDFGNQKALIPLPAKFLADRYAPS